MDNNIILCGDFRFTYMSPHTSINEHSILLLTTRTKVKNQINIY